MSATSSSSRGPGRPGASVSRRSTASDSLCGVVVRRIVSESPGHSGSVRPVGGGGWSFEASKVSVSVIVRFGWSVRRGSLRPYGLARTRGDCRAVTRTRVGCPPVGKSRAYTYRVHSLCSYCRTVVGTQGRGAVTLNRLKSPVRGLPLP